MKISKATYIAAKIYSYGIISGTEFKYIMDVDLELEDDLDTVKKINFIRENVKNNKNLSEDLSELLKQTWVN